MAITIKKKSNLDEIPIIDIEPLINNANSSILKKTGQKIRDACKNFGFFYIKNHNIPKSHIDTLIPAIQAFFNLPLEDKLKIHINKSRIFRGYTPLGEEFTDNSYDWHECVDFGLEIQKNDAIYQQLLGPNQWPENQDIFRTALERHWDLMIILGKKITQGLAISLELSKDYFLPYMDKSHSYMRVSHYPPNNHNHKINIGEGIGSHIDYGFLTILTQHKIGGLQIKNHNDEWLNAPIIPGTFLINIGHMIQRWSNNYYSATVHRVVSPKNNRYSIPFFFEPNFDTIVSPLEKFCDKDNRPHYKSLHFGDYLIDTFKNSYSSIIDY
ncbi:MAG: 2OG-Fe(II) oxygenase [Candidatus Marinimicrobia bacterium]|nr:2OG-Fe(II) oxygenase [Candidatus Neomarinimicrobiota bacterium]